MKEIINDASVLVIDVRNDPEIVTNGFIPAKNHGHIPLPKFAEALSLSNDDFEYTFNFEKPKYDQDIVIYGA